MKVITTNHGKAFGKKDWFTFYCGHCQQQISAGVKECQHCGEVAEYISNREIDGEEAK